jgi:hydrogenase maturation protein HypF
MAGPAARIPVTGRIARRLEVRGTVQGVGFRPFVYRLAAQLGLDGTVRNHGGRVEIQVAGEPDAIEAFTRRLVTEAPPSARVETIEVGRLADRNAVGPGFAVLASHQQPGGERRFPPDLATCRACLAELFDPADRRYRYPFINCTDCGPRATIIAALPYDRARTTMADFRLCDACRREYQDPGDRRFHAEPVACPACGPQLAWRPGTGPVTVTGDDALRAAVRLLLDGGIVAVKGLGGYHLACDATSQAAVERLRARKHRPAKPLAVMVDGLATARALADVSGDEIDLLAGPAAPIVLLDRQARPAAGPPAPVPLAPAVLAGERRVGLLLPYTPLHHLLLTDLAKPIVLTSGNRADEPIAVGDDEALRRLGAVADGFLVYDRRILARYEDSVTRVVGGRQALVRRGRGYAPEPLRLPVAAAAPLLGVGAQLKHTFTLAGGARAHLAGHTGDLEDLETLQAFERDLERLGALLELEPEWVAHDLHPGYLSTRHAVDRFPPARRIPVQHHHAHVAACAAEHGIAGPVLGVALDGLGLGDDGTLWGGEVLLADLGGYRRLGRFGRAPLPGGEAAVRQPWRMALGYLLAAEGDPGEPAGLAVDPALLEAFMARQDPATIRVLRQQVARGLNSPVASSAGRLFDAAASLLDLRDVNRYEADAAIALEQAAAPGEDQALPWRLRRREGLLVYDPRPTLAALLEQAAGGIPAGRVAGRFQNAVAAAVAAMVTEAHRATGVGVVCCSGGVFCNDRLTVELPRLLEAQGLEVHSSERVPAGDGGISFGQAAVAAAQIAAATRGRTRRYG